MNTKLTRHEIDRFDQIARGALRVLDQVLGTVFDELGGRPNELKLRVGAALSALELAQHTRLNLRRAVWHACTVLMTLHGAAPRNHDAQDTIEAVAGIAHTLSLAAIAIESEIATPEAVEEARKIIEALGTGEVSFEGLIRAHNATLPAGPDTMLIREG